MNILRILLIINLTFTSVNGYFNILQSNNYIQDYQPTGPIVLNSNEASTTFCLAASSEESIKFIEIYNISSKNSVTLTKLNQTKVTIHPTEKRESVFIFKNPPKSECYALTVTSKTSIASSINMNNIQVRIFYNTYTTQSTTKSTTTSNHVNRETTSSTVSTVRPCLQNPCQNGGDCLYYQNGTYRCKCSPDYFGNNCQYSLMIQPSINLPCLMNDLCNNGGTCQVKNIKGEIVCYCQAGFSGDKCQISNHSLTTTIRHECGTSKDKTTVYFDTRSSIVQPVRTHTWLWIVSIQTLSETKHICEGTLIDPLHVITAARCLDKFESVSKELQIVAGLLDLQHISMAGIQSIRVANIFIHEGYNPITFANNIAIIVLSTPVRITSAVNPICLPKPNVDEPKIGEKVQIAGWNYRNRKSGMISQELNQATLEIVEMNSLSSSKPSCVQWTKQGYSINNAQQICATVRTNQSSLCQGSIGGPVISSVNSKWFLTGIVSYGDGLCTLNAAAGVYTRVSAYIKWIEEKLKL